MSTHSTTHESYKYTDHYTDPMSSKTIMVMNDVYELLKSKKREGESFSDVIRRLNTPPKRKFSDCIGLWADIPDEDFKRMERNILSLRKGTTKALLKKWEG